MNYIQNNCKVYFAFTITIILWASAFPVIKLALIDFSAVHLSSLRLSIASLILLILTIIKKIPIPDFKDIPIILLLGFCGFTLYHIALSFGEYYVSAGVSSLIVSTTPIFSALLATYFLKEKFSKLAWIGSIIALIGVACIALGNDSKVIAMCIGIALVLIASIGESIYFVFQSSYFKKYGFIPFTIYTMLAGSLFTFIFLPGAIHDLQYADTNTLLLVLYLGVFPTVIPYFALAYTIYKVGVADATMSLYLTPACALVLSFIMVGEMPTMVAIIGGIVTLIGVSITTNHAKNIG
ncbi:DMT family transporter [Staphylococcus succinus]|uniref:DMT family transporter n=1 Tax=Staphylococcus succinus TaxID=61015 RepID=UPI002DB941CD|nr:EamA family transporter [Staphylococcus succinus]MEB7462036.1 DMT family transporter [Staphylococcus succinus]